MSHFSKIIGDNGYYDSDLFPFSCVVHRDFVSAEQAMTEPQGYFGLRINASLLRKPSMRRDKSRVDKEVMDALLAEGLTMAARLRDELARNEDPPVNVAEITRRADVIRNWYEARRGPEEYEPSWIHPAFEPAFNLTSNPDSETRDMIDGCYESIMTKNGTVVEAFPGLPGGPKRIIEDGMKVGTTSWIFLGRNHPAHRQIVGNWVILGRKWADDGAISYMAYHRHRPMGLSAMTGDEIGPCFDLAEVVDWVGGDEQAHSDQSPNGTHEPESSQSDRE